MKILSTWVFSRSTKFLATSFARETSCSGFCRTWTIAWTRQWICRWRKTGWSRRPSISSPSSSRPILKRWSRPRVSKIFLAFLKIWSMDHSSPISWMSPGSTITRLMLSFSWSNIKYSVFQAWNVGLRLDRSRTMSLSKSSTTLSSTRRWPPQPQQVKLAWTFQKSRLLQKNKTLTCLTKYRWWSHCKTFRHNWTSQLMFSSIWSSQTNISRERYQIMESFCEPTPITLW